MQGVEKITVRLLQGLVRLLQHKVRLLQGLVRLLQHGLDFYNTKLVVYKPPLVL